MPLPTLGPWGVAFPDAPPILPLTFSTLSGAISTPFMGAVTWHGFYHEDSRNLIVTDAGPLSTFGSQPNEYEGVAPACKIIQANLFELPSGSSTYYLLAGFYRDIGSNIFMPWFAQYPMPTKVL